MENIFPQIKVSSFDKTSFLTLGFENLIRGQIYPPSRILEMFIIWLTFCVILSLALLIVYFLVSFTSRALEEKITAFECGFDPLREIRSPFSTRFFLLVVLFLIFDVEVALLFPLLRAAQKYSSDTLIIGLFIFLVILIFGMFHEWNEGSLDWVSHGSKDKLKKLLGS